MLLRVYLVLGAVVSLGFAGAALSGWRMIPKVPPRPGAVVTPGSSSGLSGGGYHPIGGGHHTSGYHSTWHGGK